MHDFLGSTYLLRSNRTIICRSSWLLHQDTHCNVRHNSRSFKRLRGPSCFLKSAVPHGYIYTMLSTAGIVLITALTPRYSTHRFMDPSLLSAAAPVYTSLTVPSALRTSRVVRCAYAMATAGKVPRSITPWANLGVYLSPGSLDSEDNVAALTT